MKIEESCVRSNAWHKHTLVLNLNYTRTARSTNRILLENSFRVFHTIHALSPCNNSLSSIRMWAEAEGRGIVYVSCLNIKLHLKNSPPCHHCQSQTSSPSVTCRQGNESGCSMSPIHQRWQATFAWFRSDGASVTAGGRAYFCWRWRNYCVCSAVKWVVRGVSFSRVLNGISGLPSSRKYS